MSPGEYNRKVAAARAAVARLPAPALRWLIDYLISTGALHPADLARAVTRWQEHDLNQRERAAWAAYQDARAAETAALRAIPESAAGDLPAPGRGAAIIAYADARKAKAKAAAAWDRARRAADRAFDEAFPDPDQQPR